jgi:competence protein ComEC
MILNLKNFFKKGFFTIFTLDRGENLSLFKTDQDSKFYKKNITPFLISIILLFCIFSIEFVFAKSALEQNILTINFLDVGQGDAIFIETPNKNQVLIDGGQTAMTIRSLQKIIPFYDKGIDLLIATHNDMDHIGGFPEIFDRFKIKYYADYGLEESGEVINLVKQKIEMENLQGKFVLQAGNEIILDKEKNIILKVLWPVSDFISKDRNEHSIVLMLIYNEIKILLTGDATLEVEKHLIDKFGNDLHAIILKAGHHGSKTSTGENFLEKVKPNYVIISAGKDNKFGHPHQEVLNNINSHSINVKENVLQQNNVQNESVLSNSEIEILETSKHGNIIFKTNGKEIWLK